MSYFREFVAVSALLFGLGCVTTDAYRDREAAYVFGLRACVHMTDSTTARLACHAEYRDACISAGLPANCAEVYP